jgi:hypothetical protein
MSDRYVDVTVTADVPKGWSVECKELEEGHSWGPGDSVPLLVGEVFQVSAYHGTQPEQRLTWKVKAGDEGTVEKGFVKLTVKNGPPVDEFGKPIE